ncbi:paREP5ab, internal deletion and authentic frameshift [Pyrobaculum aerophilum str. IM2]|uniref:PaREP5ab, internal deletion and authentic frameshift n=2 Tax=Pyrobaculum aerophilum TaxID=13773 RepID=Q8ZUH2_PYRAE|nr:hypothetical protein [Pyrobaculum aerophilum]AAL64435.1 paREP5ab, internal deletion and authentic frameshift [Pyrobaculum aerophilum str. IM2]HII47293.1 hypothetical protein [Pyrobaculum aerophilum]
MSVVDIITAFLQQMPAVAVAVVLLYALLDRKLTALERRMEKEVGELRAKTSELAEEVVAQKKEVGERLERLDKGIEELRAKMGEVDKRLYDLSKFIFLFNKSLIEIHHTRDIVSEYAFITLSNLVQIIPPTKSKYYTEEVREELKSLLNRVKTGHFDWRDIARLKELGKVIYKEWWETGREDLINYYYHLQLYIWLLEAKLLREGKMPPSPEVIWS